MPLRSLPFASFVANIHEQLGLVVICDISFDTASGRFSATRLDPDRTPGAIELEIHPDDQPKLIAQAKADPVKLDLRTVSAARGNICLLLLGNEGEGSWQRGAILDLPTPEFAVEKIAARSRLSELGKQCAAIAHEIRQPLFTIDMASENLRIVMETGSEQPPQAIFALERIKEEVQRASTIVEETLNYAAGRSRKNPSANARIIPRQADFSQAVDSTLRLLSYEMEKARIKFERDLPALPILVMMPQIELEQIFVNILRNSMESIGLRKQTGWTGEGEIKLALEIAEGRVRCTISDNGAGLSDTVPERGFQPFVTTKGDDGNGLGLYICEQLLAKTNGRLRLLPGDGHGATVEIVLPLHAL